MKKHTKLLSLALVLVMALALFPAPAMAAEEPVNCVGATKVTDGRVTLELSNPIMAIAATVDDNEHDIYGVNGRADLSPLYVVPAGTKITWAQEEHEEITNNGAGKTVWSTTTLNYETGYYGGNNYEGTVADAVEPPFTLSRMSLTLLYYGTSSYGIIGSSTSLQLRTPTFRFLGIASPDEETFPLTGSLVVDVTMPGYFCLNGVREQKTAKFEGETLPLYEVAVGSGFWYDFASTDGTMNAYTVNAKNGTYTRGEVDFSYDTKTSQWGAASWYGDDFEEGEYRYCEINQEGSLAPIRFLIHCTNKANIAYPSTQTVDIDGKKVEFQMYALKDENGYPTNYIKVRDLALALNGTKAQFAIEWDGKVNLVPGRGYTPNGSENKTPFSGERAYTTPASATNVNGSASDLTAIFLTDDNGGGYTYYQLRDLGKALGFNVGWSGEKGAFIETNKPYDANN